MLDSSTDELDELLKLAKLEFNKGNFVKTQEICFKIIPSKPNDIKVLNLLAVSYAKCGEHYESLECFKKAFCLDQKCAEIWNNIGSVYWNMSKYDEASYYYKTALQHKINYVNGWINFSGASFKRNDLVEAGNAYNVILMQDPKLYKVRNMKGHLLLSSNQIKEAKKQFKIAKNDGPEFPDTWNNLGYVYLITDKFEKAILHYKRALELNSKLLTTWINLGIAYSKLNTYQNSIQSFQKVLRLCPENVLALENLATIYEHNTKNLSLAVEYYKKLLKLKPNSFELNLKLGFLYLLKLGKYQESESYFKTCIELNPEKEDPYKYLIHLYELQRKQECAAKYYAKLGDLYLDKNNFKNASIVYTHTLKLDSENAYGHWKLGLTLYKMGYADLALLRYKKAIDINPDFPDAYCDSALVYESMDMPQKASTYYNMALQLQPNHKNTLLLVSKHEFKFGNLDKAAEYLAKINEICSSSEAFDFLIKLANAFCKMKNFKKAIFHYEKALQIDSTCVDVYLHMGNLFVKMNKSDEALYYFYQAIKFNPQCVMAYTNIGSMFRESENFTEAIKAYKSALNIDPDFRDAYCNLVQCLQHVCDWSDYDNRIAKVKDIVHQQLDNELVPFLSPLDSILYPFSSEELKKIASKYAEQCVENAFTTNKPPNYVYQMPMLHLGRIRVGYVSLSDFPTSQLMDSIARYHDRNRIEVFCYSLSPDYSYLPWSEIYSASDHFKNISDLNVIDAANLINEDRINILVNMTGYTKGARNEIFALRPAPVQVQWFGYPATSGAKFFDYLITDKICSPSESIPLYTEKLAYMDRTVFIGDHKLLYDNIKPRVLKSNTSTNNTNSNTNNERMHFDNTSKESMLLNSLNHNMYCINMINDSVKCYTRDLYDIPEDAVVYCNFSRLYKLDPSTFKMWATILHNVPNSVLWLLRVPADGVDNLRKYATDLKIDPARLIFSNLEPKHEHIIRIQLADVFLDTPLSNGHTCLDAIWAGTPVVTLPRDTFASRIATSQLTTLGNTFTVAQNDTHYIEIAIRLGTDSALLEFQRKLIWSLKYTSTLFDCQSYTKELESLYSKMWNTFLHSNSNI